MDILQSKRVAVRDGRVANGYGQTAADCQWQFIRDSLIDGLLIKELAKSERIRSL